MSTYKWVCPHCDHDRYQKQHLYPDRYECCKCNRTVTVETPPETEFGHVVSSLGWAFEVALKEGEVWYIGHRYTLKGDASIGYNFYDDEGLRLDLSSNDLFGWERKLNPKQELLKDINKSYQKFSKVYNGDELFASFWQKNVGSVLEKYFKEIEK